VTNKQHLSVVENYNHTVRQISAESKYCKIVFAEDWIYPNCIEEMVRAAECHPSVGLVGGYTTDGQAVLWKAPAPRTNPIPGRDICRSILQGGPYVLGSMTSLLVRSDLVRRIVPFFDEQTPPQTGCRMFRGSAEKACSGRRTLNDSLKPSVSKDDRIPADRLKG
jgi:hypothetical protein